MLAQSRYVRNIMSMASCIDKKINNTQQIQRQTKYTIIHRDTKEKEIVQYVQQQLNYRQSSCPLSQENVCTLQGLM
jgi:hypothetical protein